MGCHTWLCAKADKQPDFEEIKSEVLKIYQEEINFLTKHINGDLEEDEKWLLDDQQTIEDSKYKLSIFERQVRIMNKNLCKIAICNKYDLIIGKDEFERSYKYDSFKQTLYVDLAGCNLKPEEEWYYDTFRIENYPQDKLYSLQQTLDFIKTNTRKIRFGYLELSNPENTDPFKRKWKEFDRIGAKKKAIKRLKEFWNKYPDGMIYFG